MSPINHTEAGSLVPGDIIDITPWCAPGVKAIGHVERVTPGDPGFVAITCRVLTVDGDWTDRWGIPHSNGKLADPKSPITATFALVGHMKAAA